MIVSTKVKHPTRQEPLLAYMSGRFTYRPPAAWQQLIEQGLVRCNGEVATVDTRVSAGDVLTTTLPDARPPEVDFSYSILYEDPWLLAINKPPNLRVHGRGAFVQANLIYHLRHEHRPPYPDAHLINRLDGDTSGAVLLARDTETLKVMQQMFRYRAVRKRYLAWVLGVPHPRERVVNRPIGQLPSLPGVYRFGSGPAAPSRRPAATRIKVEQQFGDGFARVALTPYTGRTHQLRAHLAEIGHPLIGDQVYQQTDEMFLIRHAHPDAFPPLLLDRHALHCRGYAFIHPHSGEMCSIDAPLAPDLVELNEKLGEFKNG